MTKQAIIGAALRLAALLLLAALAACSGARTGGGELAVRAPAPGAFALPAPADLLKRHKVSYSEIDLVRTGSAFEFGLPHNLAAADGATGVFTPDFSPAQGSLAGLSYVIYAFNLQGYDREQQLSFDWSAAPQTENLHIGVANLDNNAWDWFSTDDPGLLAFEFAGRVGPGPGHVMLVALAFTGSQEARLTRLRVGSDLSVPLDSLFVIADKNLAADGEHVRVTVFANETAAPLRNINLRLLLPAADEYVPGSLNLGSPGGARTAKDGIWGQSDAEAFMLTEEASISKQEYGFGLDYIDFAVSATAGSAIEAASGALFNFEVEVHADTTFSFLQGDSENLTTYYSGTDIVPQFWSDVSNASQPGIKLQANSAPVAQLSSDVELGPIPLEVEFDAAASSDTPPGSIVKYEFDFGDGGGFQDNGSDPVALHTYDSIASYTVFLRVTDNQGAQAQDSLRISAGSTFDETEDNDSKVQANQLPALPLFDYSGSLGDNAGAGYDGDALDVFKATIPVSTRVSFILRSDSSTGAVAPAFRDANGLLIAEHPGGEDEIALEFVVAGLYAQPLNLWLADESGGWSDYSFDIMINPPLGSLSASPSFGDSPLQATLDAGASLDDGSIATYEFDPLGDGAFSAPQAGATFPFEYTVSGRYRAAVRLTDNLGNQSVATTIVSVDLDPFDEVEDNDTTVGANLLIFPLADFDASLGSGSGYVDFDGDALDFFMIPALVGQTIDLTATLNNATGNLDMELVDSAGDVLATSNGLGPTEYVNYTLQPADTAPCHLRVYRVTGYSDYVLSGDVT